MTFLLNHNNLLLIIYCKSVVKILWTYHFFIKKIFSPFFSSQFFILSKISLNKHTLNDINWTLIYILTNIVQEQNNSPRSKQFCFILCLLIIERNTKRENKNVWSSVLLKPTNPAPKCWSWACWTAWWSHHLRLWFSQLWVCHPFRH